MGDPIQQKTAAEMVRLNEISERLVNQYGEDPTAWTAVIGAGLAMVLARGVPPLNVARVVLGMIADMDGKEA